jgi:O-methyltransferase domain
MRFVINHKVAPHVPIGRDISISKLGEHCGVDGEILARVLRYCITNGLFRETKPGFIGHTAASAALAGGQLGIAMRWSVEIPALSSLRMFEASKKFSTCDNPRSCGFNIEYQTDETYWEYQERNPELAAMFSDNMVTESGTTRLSPKHAVRGFHWGSIGNGTVVDVSGLLWLSCPSANVTKVGGSSGHVSMAISREYPDLKFIVQDRTSEIASWQKNLPARYHGRITYEYHDFFTSQMAKGDVYFYRYILHNWCDVDVLRILGALTSALKVGTRLLISEYIGPSGGAMGEFEERTYR